MAPPRKLKVFRTAIGFHDAYVAVPSKKAALEAWGSDRNLFAIGAAEAVEEGALAEQARATPGTVIKVARGTADQHLAALPKNAKRKKTAAPIDDAMPRPARPRVSRPRPNRKAMERAHTALEQAEQARNGDLERLDRQIAALTEKRRAVRKGHDERIADLRTGADEAQKRYDDQMAKWSENDG